MNLTFPRISSWISRLALLKGRQAGFMPAKCGKKFSFQKSWHKKIKGRQEVKRLNGALVAVLLSLLIAAVFGYNNILLRNEIKAKDGIITSNFQTIKRYKERVAAGALQAQENQPGKTLEEIKGFIWGRLGNYQGTVEIYVASPFGMEYLTVKPWSNHTYSTNIPLYSFTRHLIMVVAGENLWFRSVETKGNTVEDWGNHFWEIDGNFEPYVPKKYFNDYQPA